MLYDREIEPKLERSRFANSIVYLDETSDGITSHKISAVVVANQVIYDLIRSKTSEHIVRVRGGALLRGWAVLEGTGPAGCDQLSLDLATLPAAGAIIDISYTKTGQPNGFFYGRRTPVDIDEDSDVRTYTCEGWEKLHHIAGFEETYNDPAWFWVFVDCNPGLNGIWKASIGSIPNGTVLQYPTEAEVLLQLESLLDE